MTTSDKACIIAKRVEQAETGMGDEQVSRAEKIDPKEEKKKSRCPDPAAPVFLPSPFLFVFRLLLSSWAKHIERKFKRYHNFKTNQEV